MVELKTIVPGIEYDLRYATTNNFMHQQVYKTGRNTFLRLVVARALARVQQWWHFFWNNPDFELLDIDPKKFKKYKLINCVKFNSWR